MTVDCKLCVKQSECRYVGQAPECEHFCERPPLGPTASWPESDSSESYPRQTSWYFPKVEEER